MKSLTACFGLLVLMALPCVGAKQDGLRGTSRKLQVGSVILSSGETRGVMHTVQSVGDCSYIFQGDGVITIRTRQSHKVTWSSSPGAGGPFYYRLNDEHGSLEAVRESDDSVFFSTNNPRMLFPEASNSFDLVLTPECNVMIVQGSENIVWSSNRDHGISSSDPSFRMLHRGELFHVDPCSPSSSCPQTVLLQHDCNLVQYEGMGPLQVALEDDLVVWATGRPFLYFGDCYLYADGDNLRIYKGTLDRSLPPNNPHTGDILWEAESGVFGYTVSPIQGGGLGSTCPSL